MKKFLGSLPARLIIGVIVGIALGLFSANLYIGETDVGSMIMQVVLTVKSLLGSQLLCPPYYHRLYRPLHHTASVQRL